MPTQSTKTHQIHDFSPEELASLTASLVRVDPSIAIVGSLQGGGQRVQQVMQQRQQAKLKAAREAAALAPSAAGAVREQPAAVKPPEPVQLAPADQPSSVVISVPVDRQTLDDWLRPQIKDLPEIGKYGVFQPPQNPAVALRVRWEG